MGMPWQTILAGVVSHPQPAHKRINVYTGSHSMDQNLRQIVKRYGQTIFALNVFTFVFTTLAKLNPIGYVGMTSVHVKVHSG